MNVNTMLRFSDEKKSADSIVCSASRYDFLAILNDIAIGSVILLAFVYKIQLMQPRAIEPLLFPTFHHDAVIFGALLLIYLLSVWVKSIRGLTARRYMFGLMRIIFLFIALMYCADLFAYKFFATRLYFSDIIVFKGESGGILSLLQTASSVLMNKVWWKILIIVFLAMITLPSIVLFITNGARIGIKTGSSMLVTAGALMGFYLVSFPPTVYSFSDKPLFENIVERNWDYFMPGKLYSEKFRNTLKTDFVDKSVCESGRNLRPNIVLLIVESLSAYHSDFFSGINNYTPNLDKLAQEYTALTNFHANSWTTIGGMISLLTSSLPITPENAEFNTWGSPRFKYYESPSESLPNFMTSMGYKTYFLGGGDMTFMEQGKWMNAIGFKEWEDQTAEEFIGIPRGPFLSVPDKQLLGKALARIASIDNKSPYLYVVETLWSHRPWISPDKSTSDDESSVYRYVDMQIYNMYKSLVSSNFFDNGIMIITGDHRAMEPYDVRELERFGSSPMSRIPMVIISKGLSLPSVIDQDFQQQDLLPSIKSLVSTVACRSSYSGTFLAENPNPAPCIIHARGDDRDLLYVKCGDQSGNILIDGDDTRFINGDIENKKFIIDKVNNERIK